MNTITSKLEAEHKGWLDQIRSWESELDDMEKANGQIVEREGSLEVQKKVEHFQNQIIIQKGRLDEMKHNIKLYGGDISKGQQDLEDYGSYYNSLKGEFQSFSGQYS